MPRRWTGLLFAAALLVTSASRADDTSETGPLRWDPAWSHAGPADYLLTGVGLAGLAFELAFLQSHQPALRWTQPILFDEDVRNLLRGSTAGTRRAAETAAWVLLVPDVAYALVVDVPYAWSRYGSGVARDLFWQDTTALSLATAVDIVIRDSVGRARPNVSACLTAGGTPSSCLGSSTEATRSFPGGHFAVATTGAVLLCTQRLSMHLYGSPEDALACAAGLTAAAAVGTLKMVADDHWATDILAGGALGFAFGWGVPVVMHLHGSASSKEPGVTWAPTPIAVDRGAGLGVIGLF